MSRQLGKAFYFHELSTFTQVSKLGVMATLAPKVILDHSMARLLSWEKGKNKPKPISSH